jgi:radical SAM superfamily enzyme YgiQ (UPF0313 family)
MVNLLQAFPNTALWDRLQRENRLIDNKISADMVDMSFNFLPARPAGEITAEYVRAVDYLYEPSNYLARAYQDILAMRPTRAAAGKSQGSKSGKQKGRVPLHGKFVDLMSLLKLIWRQGVVAGYRWQFWRQLVGVYRQNPSRLQKYLEKCGMGENIFPIRESLLAKVARSWPGKMPPA